MKKKNRRLFAIPAALFCLCFLLGTALPVAAASIPESEVVDSEPEESIDSSSLPLDAEVPNTVILNLGPEWAATEFELASESGAEPYMVRVSPEGTLTLDLDGSYIYTLSLDHERFSLSMEAEADPEPVAESEPADSLQPDEADISEAPEAEQNTLIPGVPNLHVFLFGGGLLICIGALVTMTILKRRRENTDYDDEDDDEYDD